MKAVILAGGLGTRLSEETALRTGQTLQRDAMFVRRSLLSALPPATVTVANPVR